MKPVYTIRTTSVEAYRYWAHEQSESNESWNTEDKLIETIKGIYLANVKANFGEFGHLIIEKPKENRAYLSNGEYGFKWKGFELTQAQAVPLIHHAADHPLWSREIPLAKVYELPNCKLILTGTCDAIEGIECRDTKLKFSSFDVSDFLVSFQWRAYLDMLGLKTFHYDFFRVFNFQVKQDCLKARIEPCESMTCYWYEEMNRDVVSMLTEFVEYCQYRQLTDYLKIDAAKQKRIRAAGLKIQL